MSKFVDGKGEGAIGALCRRLFRQWSHPLLFKFVKLEHRTAFFDSGSVRIGTLRSFKDTASFGVNVGDENEGTKTVSRTGFGVVELSPDKHEPMISDFIKVGNNRLISVSSSPGSKGGFYMRVESPNAYIFCTSHEFSEELFLEWNRRERYDACYVVLNPMQFVLALSSALGSRAKWAFGREAQYVDGDIDWQARKARFHPALIKNGKDYDWQREHRLVWQPVGPVTEIAPVVRQAPLARESCLPFAKVEGGQVVYDVDYRRLCSAFSA